MSDFKYQTLVITFLYCRKGISPAVHRFALYNQKHPVKHGLSLPLPGREYQLYASLIAIFQAQTFLCQMNPCPVMLCSINEFPIPLSPIDI